MTKKDVEGNKIPPENSSLWTNHLTWLICGLVFSLKCLLIRCYHSTDFEVHRNWMAITHNLPVSTWYYSEVSEWTLDYPPFFAYFEKLLSIGANFWDPTILALQKTPYFSTNALIFQRSSVILVDCLYVLSCIAISDDFGNSVAWIQGKEALKGRFKLGLFCLVLLNPGLILLDNVHFQYNSFLYSLMFLSVICILRGRLLSVGFHPAQGTILPLFNYYRGWRFQGAFVFAVLLNFKHIYLYYVPAFVCVYLSAYLFPLERNLIKRVLLLALVIAAPVVFSFGPFMLTGGLNSLRQIMSRLFPFQRGLTHAYWAPNFWALYNFADFCLYKLATVAVKVFKLECGGGQHAYLCSLQPPMYTQGLVMEYTHSLLPNISPTITLLLILISIVPVAAYVVINHRQRHLHPQSFLITVTLSAYGFFLFGWHVHEKAALMMLLPMTLLALQDVRFLHCYIPLCFGSLISLLPLFFTPLEDLVKYSLTGAYFILISAIFFLVFRLRQNAVLGVDKGLLVVMLAAEAYKCFFHRAIFGDALPFLPLMLVSVVCAHAVCLSYIRLLLALFAEQWFIRRAMRECLQTEQTILNTPINNRQIDEEVSLVGGVDISACPDNPSIGVASLTVLKWPQMEVFHIHDEVVHLPYPYIPEYLAVREAHAMADLVNKSDVKVDVLFVDGNGAYHSRGCGLATQVGYLSGTRSVGVAKNFNGFPLHSLGMPQEEVDSAEEKLKSKLKQLKGPAVLELDATEPTILNVLRVKNSTAPLYISAGYGMDLPTSTKMVADCFGLSSLANPIRLSDLRSRALLREFFLK